MVVCCGLPLLLAVGTGVTVAGVGVRSGLLVVAGMIAAIAGLFVWRDGRRTGCSLVGASDDD
jgi:hypothetical protein